MQGGKGQTKPSYEGGLVETYIRLPLIIALLPYDILLNGHIIKYLEMGPQFAKDLISHVNWEVMNGPIIGKDNFPWSSPRRNGFPRGGIRRRLPIRY